MPATPVHEQGRLSTSNPHASPQSPQVAAIVGLSGDTVETTREPAVVNGTHNELLPQTKMNEHEDLAMQLELQDGTTYRGISFGAESSVAGELVFQTGMVGYPESITDPSYRGQILVITFPLIGNYGVPSRKTMDMISGEIPAHFEANQIHVAAVVVVSYCGEDYSHHLAVSSLGTWLKEQGIPAMYGVDTRALTKRIREEGSMLGKVLVQRRRIANGVQNEDKKLDSQDICSSFEDVQWLDPNTKNLVADGERNLVLCP